MGCQQDTSPQSLEVVDVDRQRLLERFLKYVKVDTMADVTSSSYPSSVGQLELGKLLVAELQEIGLSEVEQDENGLVWATVLPTTNKDVPSDRFQLAPGYQPGDFRGRCPASGNHRICGWRYRAQQRFVPGHQDQ